MTNFFSFVLVAHFFLFISLRQMHIFHGCKPVAIIHLIITILCLFLLVCGFFCLTWVFTSCRFVWFLFVQVSVCLSKNGVSSFSQCINVEHTTNWTSVQRSKNICWHADNTQTHERTISSLSFTLALSLDIIVWAAVFLKLSYRIIIA